MTNTVANQEFAGRYGRWALIAGASEGIGADLADQLAARGLNLILIARNESLLQVVAAALCWSVRCPVWPARPPSRCTRR